MTTRNKGTTGTTGRVRQAKTKVDDRAGAFSLLLVEGDPNARRRLKRMLLKTAPTISIIEANSVTTAIRRFDDHRPGTILLALALPDGDGLEVLCHAMATDPHCMVIVLTDHATDALRHGRNALTGGADQPRAALHLPHGCANEVADLARRLGRLQGCLGDAVEEELQPCLPVAILADLLQQVVILAAMRLEVEAEIEDRLLQDALRAEQEGDQQAAETAVPIEERMAE